MTVHVPVHVIRERHRGSALGKLIKVLVVLLVLIIGAVVFAFTRIDSIARAAIERGSTHALKVDTKLDSAKLKIFDGRLGLGGLNVSNPQGYKTPHFLNMKTGDVAVSLGSLQKDVVEVGHIHLSDIDMNLEKKDGKANYQVILDNLKGSETGTKPESKEGKRFIVKELSIKNVNVHLRNLTPVGGNADVPIDEIKLQNVGSESNKGLLLEDLSGVIVKALFAAIVARGGGVIPAEIAAELQNGLSQLQDITKIANVGDLEKTLGNLGGSNKDVTDKAKEAVDKAVGGIGDLIGGKKK